MKRLRTIHDAETWDDIVAYLRITLRRSRKIYIMAFGPYVQIEFLMAPPLRGGDRLVLRSRPCNGVPS